MPNKLDVYVIKEVLFLGIVRDVATCYHKTLTC